VVDVGDDIREFLATRRARDLNGVSESVLLAVAKALRLDDAERAHLFELPRASQPAMASRPPRAPPSQAGGPPGPAVPAARDDRRRPSDS
jgi:hypothetical protein